MNSLYNGNLLRTHSGKMIDVFNPDPDMICIEDIAHALSHICRFGGHTTDFYSVAQHSVMCASLVPHSQQLEALMHDATEAYLLDIPSPIKRQLPGYEQAEDNLMRIIADKYKLEYPFVPILKIADKDALEYEYKFHVLQSSPCTNMSPEMAKQVFLEKFKEYSNGR